MIGSRSCFIPFNINAFFFPSYVFRNIGLNSIYRNYMYLNNSLASSFLEVSCMSRTSALTGFVPKEISIISPTLTSLDALATFPFIVTRPALHASAATVLLLINLDTLRYLSNLIQNSFFYGINGMELKCRAYSISKYIATGNNLCF